VFSVLIKPTDKEIAISLSVKNWQTSPVSQRFLLRNVGSSSCRSNNAPYRKCLGIAVEGEAGAEESPNRFQLRDLGGKTNDFAFMAFVSFPKYIPFFADCSCHQRIGDFNAAVATREAIRDLSISGPGKCASELCYCPFRVARWPA